MSATDPLADYRLGPAESPDDLRDLATPQDGDRLRTWSSGGQPILLTERSLLFIQEGEAYRVPKGKITAFGLTRASDTGYKRWGIGLYLLALPVLMLATGAGAALLVVIGVLMACLGALLVTLGFISKAILVQVDDDRVPPFVLDTRGWRSLRSTLRSWR